MDQVNSIIDGGCPVPPGPGRGPGTRPQGPPGNASANWRSQRGRGSGGPVTAGRAAPAVERPAQGAPPRQSAPPRYLPGDARATGRDSRSGGAAPADPGNTAAGPGRSAPGQHPAPVDSGESADHVPREAIVIPSPCADRVDAGTGSAVSGATSQ